MYSTLVPCFILLAALAIAIPSFKEKTGVVIPITRRYTLVNADGSINVEELDFHISYVKAKIRLGFDNYEKNTGTVHPFSMKGTQKREMVVPLANHGTNVWYGTIRVGDPDEPFDVVFDTGSSDLFLPVTACGSCLGHTRWDPSASSTMTNLTQEFELCYILGATVSGILYTDSVILADFMAASQVLGGATKYSEAFQFPKFLADGLMGMAFASLSQYGASPVFETLVRQKSVLVPVFSFMFSSYMAEMYIGGANSRLYSGSFTFVDVLHQSFWLVKMDSIEDNKGPLFINLPAVIDTGTGVIIGPSTSVAKLHKLLGGEVAPQFGDGRYTFPCGLIPKVSLGFGGGLFPIPSSTLGLGKSPYDTSQCISGIVGSDVGLELWIVGNVFLETVYTTFDLANKQVGFARLA